MKELSTACNARKKGTFNLLDSMFKMNLTSIQNFVSACIGSTNIFNEGTPSYRKFELFKQKILQITDHFERLDMFSNTFLFRSYTNEKGRVISYTNKDLNPEFLAKYNYLCETFLMDLRRITDIVFSAKKRFNASGPVTYKTCTTGGAFYVSGLGSKWYCPSTKENAKTHLKANAMIGLDIAKFFPSFNLEKIFSFGMIKKAVDYTIQMSVASRDINSVGGIPVSPDSIDFPVRFLRYSSTHLNCLDGYSESDLEEIEFTDHLGTDQLSQVFYNILRFFTFNGTVPTGACYSPELTSFLFSYIDQEISDILNKRLFKTYFDLNPEIKVTSVMDIVTYLNNKRFTIAATRYIDDITISTPSARVKLLDMDLIKEIEKVLNANGLYLKYEKTRISGRGQQQKVTGLTIHKGNVLSVGSDYKFQVFKECEGKLFSELSESSLGKLAYIKGINFKQFTFAASGIKFPNSILTEMKVEEYIPKVGVDIPFEDNWQKYWIARSLIGLMQYRLNKPDHLAHLKTKAEVEGVALVDHLF